MKVSDIKDYAITSSYSGKSEISDDTLMMYLNIEYHKLANTIKNEVKNDFFYDKFTTDLKASQNEYSFEASGGTKVGIDKILSVEIKENESRRILKYSNNTNYNQPLDHLEKYGNGFYDIKDSSIFIYPTPSLDVTDGLLVQALVTLQDLSLGDEEELVFPGHTELRSWHYLLGVGMRQHIFQEQGMQNETDKAINDYERDLMKLKLYLKNRYQGFIIQERLNLSYYAN